MTVFIGDIYTSFDEIVPSKDLLTPELEGVKQVEVGPIGQCHLLLREFDPTLHGLVIVIDSRIGNKIVDAVHLHFDLFADRDFAPHYGISKHAVVFRDGSI